MARPGDDDDPRVARDHSLSANPPRPHHSRSPSHPKKEEYGHARSESRVGLRESEGDLRIREKGHVEVEYETPNTIKGIWLGTYFFFSLLLTLYNKLILGSVCATSREC